MENAACSRRLESLDGTDARPVISEIVDSIGDRRRASRLVARSDFLTASESFIHRHRDTRLGRDVLAPAASAVLMSASTVSVVFNARFLWSLGTPARMETRRPLAVLSMSPAAPAASKNKGRMGYRIGTGLFHEFPDSPSESTSVLDSIQLTPFVPGFVTQM